MSEAINLTMLVPGSVWERKSKKKSTKSTILFITNTSLSEEGIEKHPPQVVFITEKLFVLSQGVDDFLRSRTFYGMYPRIEELTRLILTEPEGEDGDGDLGSIDDIDVSDDPIIVPEELSADDTDFESALNESKLSINFGPHPDADLLASNFVSYEEAPFHTNDTLHKITFSLSQGLTLDTIRKAFLIRDPNAIQKFSIVSSYEVTMIDIDSYVDTMLSVDQNGGVNGVLYVLSPGDFRYVEEVNTDRDQSIDDIVITDQPVVTTPNHTLVMDATQVVDITHQVITQSNTLNVMPSGSNLANRI